MIDWAEVLRFFCQPKAMAGNISLSDFGDLTFFQLKCLLEKNKEQKKKENTGADLDKHVKEFRRVKCGPGSPNWEAVQKKYPTDEDKRAYYGIWPLS